METEKLKQAIRELNASIDYYDELAVKEQPTKTGIKDANLKLKFTKEKILMLCMKAEKLLK